MVAEMKRENLKSEKGQALIELMLMMPIFLVVIYMIIKTNQSVQVSINNQKYTREMLLRLTYSSPWIYNRSIGTTPGAIFNNQVVGQGHHRLTFGLADEALGPGAQPIATTQRITRSVSVRGDDTAGEVDRRSEVRVRNTLTLCGPWAAAAPGVELTNASLTETSQFDICSGPAPVEGG